MDFTGICSRGICVMLGVKSKVIKVIINCHLIKDGLIWTNEAPLEHLLLTIRILDWVAHVEELTIIGNISIVTISSTITRELVHDVLSDGVSI